MSQDSPVNPPPAPASNGPKYSGRPISELYQNGNTPSAVQRLEEIAKRIEKQTTTPLGQYMHGLYFGLGVWTVGVFAIAITVLTLALAVAVGASGN